MDIERVESQLGLQFPPKHRAVLLDVSDPIHERTDFLVLESPYSLLRIEEVNAFLHESERPDPWPEFLVAFASYGCGDYFAYDLRHTPPSILYVDPDLSVSENLASSDQLRYASFEAWYEKTIKPRERT